MKELKSLKKIIDNSVYRIEESIEGLTKELVEFKNKLESYSTLSETEKRNCAVELTLVAQELDTCDILMKQATKAMLILKEITEHKDVIESLRKYIECFIKYDDFRKTVCETIMDEAYLKTIFNQNT